MEVNTGGNQVVRSGVQAESNFQIRGSAKAFEILSSGLYTDPKTAVIRELACNAFDAHTEANRHNHPIQIHLPNHMEPFFSVKDEGIGLSDTDVRGLYSTYFDSTKAESNEQIGGFGLGSKSPFSYSKAFTVISIHEGYRRMYSIFINEEGIPTISLLNEIASDEHNGVEVKLTVHEKDFMDFERKTATVLRFFPVVPNVIGVTDFEFDSISDEDNTIRTTNGTVIVSNRFLVNDAVIIQGNVPYAVNGDDIIRKLKEVNGIFFKTHKLVFNMNIGEVEVAANRESVRITQSTIDVLSTKITAMRLEYLQKLDEKVQLATDNITSKFDAYVIIAGIFKDYKWELSDIMEGYNVKCSMFKDWITDNGNVYHGDYNLEYHTIRFFKRGFGYNGGKAINTKVDGNNMSYIKPTTSVFFATNNVSTRFAIRTNQLFDETIKRVMLVTPISLKTINLHRVTDNKPPLVHVPYDKEHADIVQMFGSPTFTTLSESTTDPRKGIKRIKTAPVRFRKFDHSITMRANSRVGLIETQEQDVPNDGVYFEIDSSIRKNVKYDERNLGVTHTDMSNIVVHMLKVINALNGTDHRHTYAVTKRTANAIKKSGQWTNIFDLYQDTLNNHPEMNKAVDFVRNLNSTYVFGFEQLLNTPTFLTHVNALEESSYFRTTFAPLITTADIINKYTKVGLTADDLLYIRTCSNNYVPLKYTFELRASKMMTSPELVTEYPMFSLIDNVTEHTLDDVMEYINLVDQQSLI